MKTYVYNFVTVKDYVLVNAVRYSHRDDKFTAIPLTYRLPIKDFKSAVSTSTSNNKGNGLPLVIDVRFEKGVGAVLNK